jgi:hypothetical protein
VIYRDDEDQDDGEYHLPTDASARFETLLGMIKAKQTPRRSQFNIMMELAPGMQIGIKGFILVKRQEIKRSHYVYAQGEKHEFAHVESADIDPVSPPRTNRETDCRDQVKLSLKKVFKRPSNSAGNILFSHKTS